MTDEEDVDRDIVLVALDSLEKKRVAIGRVEGHSVTLMLTEGKGKNRPGQEAALFVEVVEILSYNVTTTGKKTAYGSWEKLEELFEELVGRHDLKELT